MAYGICISCGSSRKKGDVQVKPAPEDVIQVFPDNGGRIYNENLTRARKNSLLIPFSRQTSSNDLIQINGPGSTDRPLVLRAKKRQIL
jgi:hypothetical protein